MTTAIIVGALFIASGPALAELVKHVLADRLNRDANERAREAREHQHRLSLELIDKQVTTVAEANKMAVDEMRRLKGPEEPWKG